MIGEHHSEQILPHICQVPELTVKTEAVFSFSLCIYPTNVFIRNVLSDHRNLTMDKCTSNASDI